MQEQVEQILKKYGLTPKHIFGQNFLIDESVLDKIVEVANIVPGDKVIEVGPGVGNLTRKLLEKGAEVFAVEKDENFKPILRGLGKEYPGQLEVFWGDALKADFIALVGSSPRVGEVRRGTKIKELNHDTSLNPSYLRRGIHTNYKIIGNIPYYITGKLIPILLDLNPRPVSITLLVQKEVAERMVALPGEMSLLSLAVQMKSSPTYELTVPARSFYPAPKVDSAVIKLLPFSVIPEATSEAESSRQARAVRDPGLKDGQMDAGSRSQTRLSRMTNEEKKIFKLAKAAFRGKRKTLLNTLSGNLGHKKEEVEAALLKCGIDPKTRPQELSLEQWLKLSKHFYN